MLLSGYFIKPHGKGADGEGMKWLVVLFSCLWCGEYMIWAQQSTGEILIDSSRQLTSTGASGDKGQAFIDEIYQACESHVPTSDSLASGTGNMEPFNVCIRSQLENQKEKVKVLKKELSRGKNMVPKRKNQSWQKELLSRYLDKRFEEKVTGKKGEEKHVDHALFFDFYQSHLSKVAIMTINNYCVHGKTDEERKGLLANINKAEMFIGECVMGLSRTCHKSTDGDKKQRACQTMASLRSINRAIRATEERIKLARCKDEYAKTRRCQDNRHSGFESGKPYYNPQEKGKGIDDVTSLTSHEFQDHVLDEIAEACPKGQVPDEKCLKQLGVEGLDQGEVKEWQKEGKKILGEFQIQTLIVADKIKEQTSVEEIQKEVAAEGGELEEIVGSVEQMSDKQVEKVKLEMEQRYRKERESMLAGLASRFKNVSSLPANPSSQQIVEDMLNKGDELRDLLFFNNVISSYMGIQRNGEQEEDEKSIIRNLSSIERELEGDLEFVGIEKDFRESLEEQLAVIKGEERESAGDEKLNPVLRSRDVYDNILGDKEAYTEKSDQDTSQSP